MNKKKLIAIIGVIAAIIIIFWKKIALVGAFIVLFIGVLIARPEVCDDISRYEALRSGPSAEENYRDRLDMDESIWPVKISDKMDVKDYKMVYYNPWDAQYLGYLVVEYSKEKYEAEVKRLKEYKSTEYKGYYGVTGEDDYNLLAVNADPYHGFIYAMTDDKNTIIYAEQVFCNGFMDLKYENYIPKEYLLDGFDASDGNPYREEFLKKMPEVYELQANPAE